MSVVTATIEVLTAEVRVLMVGSRQVTLSVFRQLDTVGYEECDPFGRVRDYYDGRRGDSDDKWIIGRCEGILVRARFEHEDPRLTAEHVRSLREFRRRKEPLGSWLGDEETKLFNWLVARESMVPTALPPYLSALHEHSSLPLIVLAGLK